MKLDLPSTGASPTPFGNYVLPTWHSPFELHGGSPLLSIQMLPRTGIPSTPNIPHPKSHPDPLHSNPPRLTPTPTRGSGRVGPGSSGVGCGGVALSGVKLVFVFLCFWIFGSLNGLPKPRECQNRTPHNKCCLYMVSNLNFAYSQPHSWPRFDPE